MTVRTKTPAKRGGASKSELRTSRTSRTSRAKTKSKIGAKTRAGAKTRSSSRAAPGSLSAPGSRSRPPKPPAAAPVPLPSANVDVAERIEVGGRFSLEKLRTAAYDLLDERHRDRAELAPFSFHDGWASAIHVLLGAIDGLARGRGAAALGSKPTGVHVEALVGDGKDWRRQFGAVVDVSPLAEIKPSLGETRHSPLALAAQLEKLATFAAEHASELAPFGGGAAFAQTGRELAAQLRQARAAHAETLNDLSPAARELQAAKGTLYLELKRLSRAARAVVRPERRDRYSLAKLLGRPSAPKKISPAPAA